MVTPKRARTVASQLVLTSSVSANWVPRNGAGNVPVVATDFLRSRKLKSASAPQTTVPACQLYPACTPPVNPLGFRRPVPAAATETPFRKDGFGAELQNTAAAGSGGQFGLVEKSERPHAPPAFPPM